MRPPTTRTLVALTVASTVALGLSGCRVAYNEPVSPAQSASSSTSDEQTQLASQFDDLTATGYTSVTVEQLASIGTTLDIFFTDESAILAIVADGGTIIVDQADGIGTQQTDLGLELAVTDAMGGYIILHEPSTDTWLEINIAVGGN